MDKVQIYEFTLEALKDSLFDKMQSIVLRDKITDEDIATLSLAIDSIDDCKKSIKWEKEYAEKYAEKKENREE